MFLVTMLNSEWLLHLEEQARSYNSFIDQVDNKMHNDNYVVDDYENNLLSIDFFKNQLNFLTDTINGAISKIDDAQNIL